MNCECSRRKLQNRLQKKKIKDIYQTGICKEIIFCLLNQYLRYSLEINIHHIIDNFMKYTYQVPSWPQSPRNSSSLPALPSGNSQIIVNVKSDGEHQNTEKADRRSGCWGRVHCCTFPNNCPTDVT